jgi:hypothetical protein
VVILFWFKQFKSFKPFKPSPSSPDRVRGKLSPASRGRKEVEA